MEANDHSSILVVIAVVKCQFLMVTHPLILAISASQASGWAGKPALGQALAGKLAQLARFIPITSVLGT